MKTLLLGTSKLNNAAKLLKDGKIVAFPTETVFGLGVIYNNLSAISALKDVKGRDTHKPFTLMVQNTDEIEQYANLNDELRVLINIYMPGALTIIVRAKDSLIGEITNGTPFIGIRVSSHQVVNSLLKKVGAPLLVPSANKSNKQPLLNSDDVYKEFNGEISAVIKGVATGSVASTIIKIDDKITLVREGAIQFAELQKTYMEARK